MAVSCVARERINTHTFKKSHGYHEYYTHNSKHPTETQPYHATNSSLYST